MSDNSNNPGAKSNSAPKEKPKKRRPYWHNRRVNSKFDTIQSYMFDVNIKSMFLSMFLYWIILGYIY